MRRAQSAGDSASAAASAAAATHHAATAAFWCGWAGVAGAVFAPVRAVPVFAVGAVLAAGAHCVARERAQELEETARSHRRRCADWNKLLDAAPVAKRTNLEAQLDVLLRRETDASAERLAARAHALAACQALPQ